MFCHFCDNSLHQCNIIFIYIFKKLDHCERIGSRFVTNSQRRSVNWNRALYSGPRTTRTTNSYKNGCLIRRFSWKKTQTWKAHCLTRKLSFRTTGYVSPLKVFSIHVFSAVLSIVSLFTFNTSYFLFITIGFPVFIRVIFMKSVRTMWQKNSLKDKFFK